MENGQRIQGTRWMVTIYIHYTILNIERRDAQMHKLFSKKNSCPLKIILSSFSYLSHP
jgi:hypothetical protein